jgi:hypothetical protein
MTMVTDLLQSLRRRSDTELPLDVLVGAYLKQVVTAPRRTRGYFVGHDGTTPSQGKSNRSEEHLAMALFRAGQVTLPDGERLRWLDYQFPLKAKRGDRGIGKIDLLGLTDEGCLCVVELKTARSVEDPRIALLEGLAYAAIVEANLERIAVEGERACGHGICRTRPRLMLLAPAAFWANARRRWHHFAPLAADAAQALNLRIDCMILRGTASEDVQLAPEAELATLTDVVSRACAVG